MKEQQENTSTGHHATSMRGLSGQIMSNLAENDWGKEIGNWR
jgi:hypothetical protein